MPTIPNPATTEWVPLWNLNGTGGGGGGSALMDEEVGDWLPVIGGELGESGQTYKYQQGMYHRIGRLVHAWSYTQFWGAGLQGGVVGAKGTFIGDIVLKNLPFVIASSGNTTVSPYFAGVVGHYSNMLTPQDITGSKIYGSSTHSYAKFTKTRTNGQNPIFWVGNTDPSLPSPNPNPDVNDLSQIVVNISYVTDL